MKALRLSLKDFFVQMEKTKLEEEFIDTLHKILDQHTELPLTSLIDKLQAQIPKILQN